MNTDQIILKYLADTFPIKNIEEVFEPMNPEEDGISKSVLAPWSVESISANTGASKDDVIKFIDGQAGLSVKLLEIEGLTVKSVEAEPSFEPLFTEPENETVHTMSISKLMNLHVLQYVESKVSETGKPVRIEDAIFDLKNTLFLPDDFMPQHLMGMVEGDVEYSGEELRKAYSIDGNSASIYFYQENKAGNPGRIRFLYPAASGRLSGTPSNQVIREMISSSFNAIQKEKSYVEFINSRLIKTVIFNIEQKNLRELKRPVFNPAKIKILEDMNLVEKRGDIASVREDISLEELKETYSNAKAKGQILAESWIMEKLEVN